MVGGWGKKKARLNFALPAHDMQCLPLTQTIIIKTPVPLIGGIVKIGGMFGNPTT